MRLLQCHFTVGFGVHYYLLRSLVMESRGFKKLVFFSALVAGTQGANAFVISPTEDAGTLANTLIIPESGITVTSSSLNFGVPALFDSEEGGDVGIGTQSGTYTNDAGTYGLPGPGVVLSTGFVEDYQSGPNTDEGFTGINGNVATIDQNELLSEVTGLTEHFDPVQLSITFDVNDTTDTVSFFAAFGSDEWPEFVGGSVTDGFGMFLNGVNVAGALPTGGTPGVDPLLPINIDNPDMAPIAGTELDGVLAPNGQPVLRFDVPVEPGSTANVFEIILADAGDPVVDTTIYLSSFGDFTSESGGSEFTPILPSNPEDLTGGFVFELPAVVDSQIVWIDPDVATGYTYTAQGGGMFDQVVAPSLLSVNDPDGYTITYTDSNGNEITVDLNPGETYSFSGPVFQFLLEGINEDLMLDPTDGTAFVTGLSFAQAGQFTVTQVPVITFVDDGSGTAPPVSVSEPGSLALLCLSLFGLGAIRSRKV
jgi:hypothetical protein